MFVVWFAYFTSTANPSESRSTPAEVQPIRDKRQSHSVYNGDVSGNQNEGVHGKKSINGVKRKDSAATNAVKVDKLP